MLPCLEGMRPIRSDLRTCDPVPELALLLLFVAVLTRFRRLLQVHSIHQELRTLHSITFLQVACRPNRVRLPPKRALARMRLEPLQRRPHIDAERHLALTREDGDGNE